MKIELIHLATYLPYGLRIKEGNTEFEMTGSFLDEWFNYGEPIKGKPILISLYDFPLIITNIHPDDEKEIAEAIQDDTILQLRHDLFIKLVEQRFDVFHLIDEGLAIDENLINP